MSKLYDVIVVGAGYAGISASYYLKKRGLDHIIFERGKIGESWRSQRWDSFRFNSTNKLNLLPGEIECDNPDEFGTAPDFVHALERYVSTNGLRVKERTKVISVEKPGDNFHVKVLSNGNIEDYFSKQILIASGASNENITPSVAKNVPGDIQQFHTSEYKNEKQLPDGAVLVVGGAQSGIQITEDLLNANRKVFFSTSKVGRIPRWYRGQDIFYWVTDAKLYDVKAEEIKDPKLLELKPPHVSGTGDGKTALSLQSIAKRGAIILGKLNKIDGVNVLFESNAPEHIRFADEFSQNLKKVIDEYIEKNKLAAPAPHYDEADLPVKNASCASPITSLNLEEENINAIIWATGFDHDLSYIKLPVVDEKKKLIHNEGSAHIPGLYFLGYQWLRSRKSPILFGIIVDAEYIVDRIDEYAKTNLLSGSSRSPAMTKIEQLIKQYDLQPHPEGGWYKQTYKSNEFVPAAALPGRFSGDRVYSTAIYFLLEKGNFSAFHKIKSDECWHFYAGDPLQVFVIDQTGDLKIITLGTDGNKEERFQYMVPANCWFASRPAPGSEYSLVGCTVAPGFEFEDLELADEKSLSALYPQHRSIIKELCR